MDRRHSSYATVAGGSAGSFSHLMNPSPTSPHRETNYHATTAEDRNSSPRTFAEETSKSTHTFWGKGSATHTPWHTEERYGSRQKSAVRPSYLAGTKYLERLDAQYSRKAARQTGQRTPSLSKSSSGTSLHRMAPSHRGMTYEIVERTPPTAEDILTPPLPCKWGDKDKNGGLEITDGLEMRYVGTTKGHDLDAAAARSDHPIPRRCGIYYYEVHVVSKGKDGVIAVGFSTSKAALEKLPGWEPESWAYHGDDGRIFGSTTGGKHYGPHFGPDDVIGCGINFRTGEAFYTKNGNPLGYAFPNLKEVLQHKSIYVCVGMKRPGGHIVVNFGQQPFAFDIDELVRNERKHVRNEVRDRDISRLKTTMTAPQLTAELVSQYLRHEGFIQTAESFISDVNLENSCLRQDKSLSASRNPRQDQHAITRQKIRAAILGGDIDQALYLTQKHYPAVFESNSTILFRLKCRKFIEMMQIPTPPAESTATTRKLKSKANQDMEIDGREEFSPVKPDHGASLYSSDTSATNRLEEALRYAQELRAEYKTNDSKEISQALNEIFALFAYEDPRNSPAAGLMDEAGRLPVADGLNSAILVSLGAPSTTALELIYQQTQALLEHNIEFGGAGSMINLEANIDRSEDIQPKIGDEDDMEE